VARPLRETMRKSGPWQLDDLHQEQDENDEQDKADAAAAVVTETWSHTIPAKAEHQDQNEQKDKHLCFSPFGEVSPDGCVMQIFMLLSLQRNILFWLACCDVICIKVSRSISVHAESWYSPLPR
jgi:hypothetical protein